MGGYSLCLTAPETDFADGFGDDVLLGGQQSVEGERAAERGAKLAHGSVCYLILRLRREHERNERCEALILHTPSSITKERGQAGR